MCLTSGEVFSSIDRLEGKGLIVQVQTRQATRVASALLLTATMGQAVTIATVPVGNAGNTTDTRVMNDGTNGYGSVAYTYQMGKYDVTAGQYCEFLNAVAKTDTYGLYNTNMADPTPGEYGYGCNIKRSGVSGNYTYSVASDWANRPVNYVSWGDAARFCNWLANGQPTTGVQNTSTTEDGSYVLNGRNSSSELLCVTRKANATWVIPSEDEWYKAAYYDPNKPGGAGYWYYPTRSDTAPINVFSPTGTNNANFYSYGYGYTIGAPYYRTEVGAFTGSPSACGTYDQGGNLWQWNETVLWGDYRGMRGGAFNSATSESLRAFTRNGFYNLVAGDSNIGFRVAYVPEPASAMLLVIGGLALLRRRPQR